MRGYTPHEDRRRWDAETERMAEEIEAGTAFKPPPPEPEPVFKPRAIDGFLLAELRTKDSIGRRRHQYLCVCEKCSNKTWRRVSEVTAALQSGTRLRCFKCYSRKEVGSSGKFCGLCFGLPHRVTGSKCAHCGLDHAEAP